MVATWNVGQNTVHQMTQTDAENFVQVFKYLLGQVDVLFLQELNSQSAEMLVLNADHEKFFFNKADGRGKETFLRFVKRELVKENDTLHDCSFVVLSFQRTNFVNVHNESPSKGNRNDKLRRLEKNDRFPLWETCHRRWRL